jgi:adenylosuccinate synthase
MSEFINPAIFKERLRELLAFKNKQMALFGGTPLDFQTVYDEYAAYAEKIAPMVVDTDSVTQQALRSGKKVLLEGAQGTFLDLDHGTYPYVTSSHPISGGACLGTGVGPRLIDGVIGVCKAYTTRVGSGPFPTELLDETGEFIRTHGKEYGTVTGRSRRCGWLDMVVLRQSAMINSLSGWAVTRLDILSGFEKVAISTRYDLDGEPCDHLPAEIEKFAKCKPVLKELPGWSGDLRGCRKLEDLPSGARTYLDFIEEQTGVPVAVVSVGPDRAETISVRPDLVWDYPN